YVQDGIVLQVGASPLIDVALTIGAMSEQVNVTADALMVDSRATGVGQVVDSQLVTELPLNGRQATELVLISGLAAQAPTTGLQSNRNFPTITISVAGGSAAGVTYVMDGATHNDPHNNLNLPTPMPDALEQFKVETSSLPARYGHHAAAAVNVITKSGTNQYHGVAFGFARHFRFNEKSYFALEKDSLRRQQFGGTLGGPVLENRLFFFGAYQGRREKTAPSTAQRFVPTAAMRGGDFTTFASPSCNNRQITLRAPFVNNRVDRSAFSPAAMKFLEYVPVSDDPCGRYQFGIPSEAREEQVLTKVDYRLNDSQSIFSRYQYAIFENPAFFDGRNVLSLSQIGQRNEVHAFVAGHKWVLGSNGLNALHVSVSRTFNDRMLEPYFSPGDLGVNIYAPVEGFTNVSVSGTGFSVGSGASNPGFFNSTVFQIANDFDLLKGSHELAFGVNWIQTTGITEFQRFLNGENSFNGTRVGLPLADFMLGRNSGFSQNPPSRTNQLLNYVALYAQDTWRVSPVFTLNYGLRWEPFLPMSNRESRVYLFDMERYNGGIRSSVFPNAPPGLYFPGDEGYPGRRVTPRKLAYFAPRVGAAWQPASDTSIRAAWGMFYDTHHLFSHTGYQGLGQGVNVPNPAGGFDDPYRDYPGGNPYPRVLEMNADTTFNDFSGWITYPRDYDRQVLQQWNVSLQRQIGDWLVGATYVGNYTAHVPGGQQLNPAIYIPGQSTTGNVRQRRTLYLEDPEKSIGIGALGMITDTGAANYNGLLLSAQRRLRTNLSVLTNWTLSKCVTDFEWQSTGVGFGAGSTAMNPDHPEHDRGPCLSDRRHVVNVSGSIRTPKVTGWGLLGPIVSDWQFSPLVRWQNGLRNTPTTGVDTALTGQGRQRAIQILDNPYADERVERRADGSPVYVEYLNRDAFTAPEPGTYSTDRPRTIANPSILTNDLSITRLFPLGAGRQLQVRWEIFNAINKVNYGAPNTSLNSANFGRITSTGDPRIMQFALKFTF
ncbi:MAG TPA: TonB-dependent receptor, partial [Mycobacterium sp.]